LDVGEKHAAQQPVAGEGTVFESAREIPAEKV
jgi:hypothetical protein